MLYTPPRPTFLYQALLFFAALLALLPAAYAVDPSKLLPPE